MESLEKHLSDICKKADKGTFDDYNERQISQEIVLPILHKLKWETTDAMEVHPEFVTPFNSRIDYVLTLKEIPKVLIEVKRKSVELDEKIEKQLEGYLLDYDSKTDIVCVLTNGFMWKFYDFNKKDERIELVSVVFIEIETFELASKTLSNFLSKERVTNGDAVKELRALKKSRTNLDYNKIIEDGWSYLFSNAFLQKELVKMLNYEILICNGFSVEYEGLKQFIDNKLQTIIPAVIPHKTKFKGNLRIITQRKPRKVTIYTSTEKFEYPTMKKALEDFVRDISFNNPNILEQYCASNENQVDKHKRITKTREEATAEDENNIVDANGWYINVYISYEQAYKHIWAPLCKRLEKRLKFKQLK